MTNQTLVAEKKKAAVHFPVWKVIVFALLLFYAVCLFLPFLTIILTSITSHEEIMSSTGFTWFPDKISFEGYTKLFTDDPQIVLLGTSSLVIGFANTMWITLLPVTICLMTSGLAAYAYSKLKFKGKEVIFMFEIATMMIPMGAMTIASYTFYTWLGWANSFLPLIIPGMFGGASMIFFMRAYFDGISDDILEAAKIDGLGTVRVFFLIMVPLGIPAFIAQFIFSFVGHYNAYSGPLLYLYGDPHKYTLQLALSELQSYFGAYPAVICASSVIAMLPLIVLYCFAQKLFIEGISVGGGKE